MDNKALYGSTMQFDIVIPGYTSNPNYIFTHDHDDIYLYLIQNESY